MGYDIKDENEIRYNKDRKSGKQPSDLKNLKRYVKIIEKYNNYTHGYFKDFMQSVIHGCKKYIARLEKFQFEKERDSNEFKEYKERFEKLKK